MNIARQLLKSSSITRNFLRSSSCSTIFSLSSGYGKCGVAVIRVSGPKAKQALKAIAKSKDEPMKRYATFKALYYPETNDMIDKGLVLWFPGPSSFTGEDCCEFQVHGSLAVIAAMLDALGKIPGLRPAKPGEFTKRAFFSNKLDLTEVDGLADLIHAETEAQRKQAILQSTGSLSRVYDNWRRRLIKCAAHLEAYIDFAEDDNIEDNVLRIMTKELEIIAQDIREHLDDQRQGEMLRDGVHTAIVGAPNVGKSSFLNMMCQRQVSIVTPIAGTTRDIIESTHNFGGYPVVFADTAGLRQKTDDIVETEGIARAKECMQNADLILLLVDSVDLIKHQVLTKQNLVDYTKHYTQDLGIDEEVLKSKRVQLIANKVDLLTEEQLEGLKKLEGVLPMSCKNEKNLKPFLDNFHAILTDLCGQPSTENPRITHARYRQQLLRCIEHIKSFLAYYSHNEYPDFAIAAQKLRKAVKCIERITGHVTTDDILDVVFKDFCIGK